MSTSPISNLYNNASPSSLPSTQNNANLKDEFLKLLLTQLKYQDPLSPMDDTAMLAQQAQFASLEQMQNLNTNLVSLMAMQNVTQATSLLGKTVNATDASGNPVTGAVTGVSFDNGTPQLVVGTTTISLSDVKTIG
jgi:flagellar basal-body rod modification protein FlgD